MHFDFLARFVLNNYYIYCHSIRVIRSLSCLRLFFFAGCWLLINYIHHLLLNRFLFHDQTIFIPDVIRRLDIEPVTLHACFEETDDVPIIWILSEAKSTTIVHKLLDLLWYIFAKLIDRGLFLFLFDSGILFCF